MIETLRGWRTGRTSGFAVGAFAAVLAATAGWKLGSRRERSNAARLHRALVELLLNALTSGDAVTARHSRRVADLADVLAERLGLARDEHATLRVAALLHDLGKIDDRLFPLVHSAAPLTDEERERINQHPLESAAILRPLEPFHRGLIDTVGSHHECWSGAGYPRGIRGEEIPLGARVIAVADVFDAMVQPRSYHEPSPVEDVLRTIREGAGRRFDPAIVRLLNDPETENRWVRIAERGRREERTHLEHAG
jgi:putative nucleotidyltransferase with HDIG domain